MGTTNAAIDGCLADSVIVGRAGVDKLIRFQAEGFETCVGGLGVEGCLRRVAHRGRNKIWGLGVEFAAAAGLTIPIIHCDLHRVCGCHRTEERH